MTSSVTDLGPPEPSTMSTSEKFGATMLAINACYEAELRGEPDAQDVLLARVTEIENKHKRQQRAHLLWCLTRDLVSREAKLHAVQGGMIPPEVRAAGLEAWWGDQGHIARLAWEVERAKRFL